MNNSSSTN